MGSHYYLTQLCSSVRYKISIALHRKIQIRMARNHKYHKLELIVKVITKCLIKIGSNLINS